MNTETIITAVKAIHRLRREGMLVKFRYYPDRDIQFFIPAQPIPDIPNWREWCLKLQECGVKFEFDGGALERDWNVLKCDFTFYGRHRYRIPEQPVPATIANYLNEEKTKLFKRGENNE